MPGLLDHIDFALESTENVPKTEIHQHVRVNT